MSADRAPSAPAFHSFALRKRTSFRSSLTASVDGPDWSASRRDAMARRAPRDSLSPADGWAGASPRQDMT